MKIESLQLQNFKCFEEIHFQFDPQLTVFVGVNGAGKTTVLDALGLFLDIYAHNFYSNANRDNISQTYLRHNQSQTNLNCTITWDGKKICPSMTLTQKISNPFVDIKRNDRELLALKYEKTKQEYKYSVVTYYSGRRDIDNITNTQQSQSALMYAYVDAFKPQISFSAALAWFIEKASQEALEAVQKKDVTHTISELSAVRVAVAEALGEFGEPFVGETPPVLFIPRKGNSEEIFRVDELSDGYRTMLALIMDLARRMAIANQHIKWPNGQSVLHSPAIVLIDEVELHLHPSWQQTVLPSLMQIFPHTQFIVTTHSPQVLTSIPAKHIRILEEGKVGTMPDETEGAESSRVLKRVLGVDPRPQSDPLAQKLQEYADLVYDEKWDTPCALELQKELKDRYGNAEPLLKRLELHIENSKWERNA